MRKFIVLKDGRKVFYDLIIREDKHKVVALARDCSRLGMDACVKAFRSVKFLCLEDGSKLLQDMDMNFSYIGVAVCDPSDTFDVKKGEAVAARKLKEKLEKAVDGRKRMLGKELARMAVELGYSGNFVGHTDSNCHVCL